MKKSQYISSLDGSYEEDELNDFFIATNTSENLKKEKSTKKIVNKKVMSS